jgi:hypothetical protein
VKRPDRVAVRLSDDELARLDELRPRDDEAVERLVAALQELGDEEWCVSRCSTRSSRRIGARTTKPGSPRTG